MTVWNKYICLAPIPTVSDHSPGNAVAFQLFSSTARSSPLLLHPLSCASKTSLRVCSPVIYAPFKQAGVSLAAPTSTERMNIGFMCCRINMNSCVILQKGKISLL